MRLSPKNYTSVNGSRRIKGHPQRRKPEILTIAIAGTILCPARLISPLAITARIGATIKRNTFHTSAPYWLLATGLTVVVGRVIEATIFTFKPSPPR